MAVRVDEAREEHAPRTVDDTVGRLVPEQSAASFAAAMLDLAAEPPPAAVIRHRAERFSEAAFDAAMERVIASALGDGPRVTR